MKARYSEYGGIGKLVFLLIVLGIAGGLYYAYKIGPSIMAYNKAKELSQNTVNRVWFADVNERTAINQLYVSLKDETGIELAEGAILFEKTETRASIEFHYVEEFQFPWSKKPYIREYTVSVSSEKN